MSWDVFCANCQSPSEAQAGFSKVGTAAADFVPLADGDFFKAGIIQRFTSSESLELRCLAEIVNVDTSGSMYSILLQSFFWMRKPWTLTGRLITSMLCCAARTFSMKGARHPLVLCRCVLFVFDPVASCSKASYLSA